MGPSGFVRNKLLVGMVACGTIAGLAAVAGPVAAQAATGRHTLPGSTPRWLHSAHKLGATPSAQRVSFGIVLSMRDQAGAASQLKAISEPGSAQYGDWLSNKAFDAKYAPAKASVSAVRGWLRAQGFGVTKTLPSGMLRRGERHGDAGREDLRHLAAQLLSTTARPCGPTRRRCQLPTGTSATVSSVIAGVIGVDQGIALKQPADTAARTAGRRPLRRPAVLGVLRPEDRLRQAGRLRPHQPYVVCGYVPQQYQSAYGETSLLNAGVNGRGVTVAITDAYAAPTIYQDAQQYNQVHHQPQFTSRPVLADHSGRQRLRQRRRVRSAGLVRRGDPRRRGRPRHGARRQDRLRRRLGLPAAASTTPGPRDRQPRRRRRSPTPGPTAPTTSTCSAPTTSRSTSSSRSRRR